MKNFIITGAAGSLGTQITKNFYKKFNLICIDKNRIALKDLKKKYRRINIYECNLTSPIEVNNLIKKINKKYGNIDIILNNAGTISSIPIVSLSKEGRFKTHSYINWKKIINNNLNTTFLISSKVIENLCNNRKEGLIINVSSISAEGNIGQSAYSVAKSSIEILTKIWAQELSKFNIRVACISPGFFDIDSTHKSLSTPKIKHIKTNTPVGRLGKPTELVNAIKFIINNKFFNGKILKLDGGLEI